MGFPEDKIKLLLDDPEGTPTFTEDQGSDDEEEYMDSFSACRVLFISLAYVVVLGVCLSAIAYHSSREEVKSLEAGRRKYVQLRVFKPGNFHPEEHWNHINLKRDKPPHRFMFPVFKSMDSLDPPPRSEKAKTARYIVHNSDWGSISTISVSLNGAPFGVVMSFSDGTVDNSTGVPYFYLAAADPVVHNIKSNPWASLSLSEAQSDYCKAHNWDPEEPLCSRTTLTGKLVHVGPDELKFAQNALFTRHPVMKTWPKDHDWQTLRLNITNVWLQDFYGSADHIHLDDYFKVKL